MITPANRRLAAALGLGEVARTRTARVPRRVAWRAVGRERYAADRIALAELFADPDELPELTVDQRLFLEWHFRSPLDYAYNLSRPGRQLVVGWQMSAELEGGEDFRAVTFGVVGCTIVAGLAEDGSLHMSHWNEVANPDQIEAFRRFHERLHSRRVYVVGFHADKLAAKLTKLCPSGVYLHPKADGRTTAYKALRVIRDNGKEFVSHCTGPLRAHRLRERLVISRKRWYSSGDFGAFLPGGEDDFVETAFQPA